MAETSSSRKVAVCVDGSENSAAALKFYAENYHQPSSEILVLHVSDQLKISTVVAGGGVGYMPEGLQRALGELKQKNQSLKERYELLCQELGLQHTVHILENTHDSIGASIVDSAKKNNCTLIVIGSRGLGTVRRTFMGSVSDYIVHHAHIPVLVCPPTK